ncbi:hypothetical protein G6F57_014839 [Rhizopus arrhizus]|nr:hypothetical protein G6F57_014839 [Rhizopus arrhizus]
MRCSVPCTEPNARRSADQGPHPPGAQRSTGAVQHHGLAAGVQQAVGLQLLQHAAGHLARAADQARQFLARDAQLAALLMAHRLRLLRQVVQGAHDPVGNVQERQAAGLAAGVEQALGELLAQRIQQARGVGRQRAEEQLVQAFVADLGQFAGGTGPQDHLAAVRFDEQAHLAHELAGTEVAQHKLAIVIFLGHDRNRAADDVIQGSRRVTGSEDVGTGGISPPVAVRQETIDGGDIQGQWTAS